MSRVFRTWLLATALPCFPAALADPPHSATRSDPEKFDLSQLTQFAGASIALGGDSSRQLPDFAETTKEMTKKEGLFTLWSYPPNTADKDPEKLLAQIPAALLGEHIMLSTSFAGGGFFTGFPLDERVVRWELHDRQILLVEPETRYVIDKGKEVSDAVKRTYPERIRVAIPLLTKAPNGDPIIDLGALLKSDFADISWTSGGDMFGGSTINSALSKWTTRKTFELNVEVGVELAERQMSPPGSYSKKLVHFSFWKLPQSDYQPRVADDRVGYFLTANQDWSKPTSERDIFNRYVDRWHLVKRDASLERCEPKSPIVFYVEKTVPVKYRRAVRDGILEWNKAYDKCGFVNAVEVRQQTDDNEWKDLDPEDMRYSFFRWIVTGGGFAMGPHRSNPFTGQIYDADIVFDDSMVRFYETEAQRYLPTGLWQQKFDSPAMARFLEANPAFARVERPWLGVTIGEEVEEQMRQRAMARMRERGHQMCDYAARMRHEVALGWATMAGQPKEVIERFLYDVIKEVVMHEVGHTIGLRHNFKASSIYTLAEIQRRRSAGEATTGSVMDYNPTLLFTKDATLGAFLTPTIGPYDYWAIEYGYRPFDASAVAEGGKEDGESGDKAEGAAEGEKVANAGAPPRPKRERKKREMKLDLNNLPQEALAHLPPEVKKMLESGDMQAAAQMAAGAAGSSGAAPTTPIKEAADPTFTQAPSGETAMLRKIAGRATEPELAYATDEDTTPFSPECATNRFDMGADPVEWAQSRIELVDQRMKDILTWAVNDAESWSHLRSAFMTLLFEKATTNDFVGRVIGGQLFSRAHRGDPDAKAPFSIVDAETQRRALKFIESTLFQDEFFTFSPELLNHLAPPRWWHNGANVTFMLDFKVHETIAMLQWWNLFDRLSAWNIQRIHDNEMKTTEAAKFTAAEYIQRLQSACWGASTDAGRANGGGWSDQKPFVSSIRRSLQREYLGLAEQLVRQKPGQNLSPDLHAMLEHSLRKLGADLGGVAKSEKLDFASAAHLSACATRIDRILDAELGETQAGFSLGDTMMRPAGK